MGLSGPSGSGSGSGSGSITHVPGRLRLKSSGGVDKSSRLKDKKKKKKKSTTTTTAKNAKDEAGEERRGSCEKDEREADDTLERDDASKRAGEDGRSGGEGEEQCSVTKGKTEAEIRFEERRRQRLDDRLKKEGVKTHMERVQDLNRYLSRLSEHHDMPRIGPG